jgi:2-furoate---CoA ligase
VFDVGGGFIAAVERDPKALAVVDGTRRQNYGDWYRDIRRLVGGLDGLGLRHGDHLLIALQNTWEMASLHWACQLAGIVATPVNWRLTPEEMDYFLEDSGAKAMVFQAETAEATGQSARAAKLPRIAVGAAEGGSHAFEALLDTAPVENLPRAGPEDLSLMLYTSGTTGRGKGVPRRHRAERAAGLAHVAQNLYRFGEVTLGVMPLYHTMGVRSLLAMAAINGAFVCLPRFDPAGALALIEAERITTLYLVPTLYHDLLVEESFAERDRSSVRKLGFAGAPMTEGLMRRLDAAFKPELFVNHYGSSEIYTFTVDQRAAAKPGSAGKAGLNQIIRVVGLDASDPQDVVAAGEEGQIVASLAGDEAFEGYHRRADADAAALRQGWYFTGDVGHFDIDGDLFVTGRVDDMIITGGENVLPVEIESVLSLHPAVAEVAVAGLADARLGQQVAAFVTRREAVTAEELDAYCKASALANFKRPREYVFVKAVPKSPVGKILRRMLLAGDYERED